MIDLVAKRYVKALMLQRDISELESICNDLGLISSAFSDDKFNLIISSTDIKIEDKVNLILSFVENCSQTTTNFIKVLGENKRLDINISKINNKYKGVVYTSKLLSDDEMEKLNQQFSKKFNVSLELKQNISDYDGVKVDIDGLGIEVGFAKSRLKAQMIDHILKAV